MNRISFKIIALSFVALSVFGEASVVLAMQDPNDEGQAHARVRLTPREELLSILAHRSADAKTNTGRSNELNDDFQAFADMCESRTTNYCEPEAYLTRLNNNTMTTSYWLDLVQYLNTQRGSIDALQFRRVKEYADSFAYAPFADAN